MARKTQNQIIVEQILAKQGESKTYREWRSEVLKKIAFELVDDNGSEYADQIVKMAADTLIQEQLGLMLNESTKIKSVENSQTKTEY